MKNSAWKVWGKQKKTKTKSVQTEVIPFIPKQDLHPSDIWLYCNKALSDIGDTESHSLITNVYKPQKKFDFPEDEGSFRFQILLNWFIDEYRGKEVPINKVFNSTQKESDKKAGEAINPIADILKLCGRQNILLRGHWDSTSRSGKKWSY